MPKKIKKILKKASNEVKPGKIEVEKVKKTKIRVIGIGGGGGNIVSELAQRIEKATFLAANTDLKALKGVSRKVERFSFGQSLTHGLGTGMNPELGAEASQNEKERIKKILQDQDLVILIGSLGGGTASGAAPTFAKISKNLGNLTYGIFTLPFKFEGEKKMEIARAALQEIKPKLNAISIIPNERIFQIIDKTTPLKTALSAINTSLASSLEGLIEIIYEPGLINIDFADLRTILQGEGKLAYLNTAQVPRKEGAAASAIEKALNSPLYPYGIKGAKGVLYNIAGEKELNLEEVGQISKTISETVNKEARIIFGVSQGTQYRDTIKTTILATGLSMKNFFAPVKKPKLRTRALRSQNLDSSLRSKLRKKNPTAKKKEIKKEKETVSLPEKPVSDKKSKPKKMETEITKKPEKKSQNPPEVEIKKEKIEIPKDTSKTPEITRQMKIRKNALQLKKEIEEVEKEMLEKESLWETPAFLRRKFSRG